MFDTPILLLGFNRPNLFAELLKTIREISPTKLYIAIDGPRDGNTDDSVKVEETSSCINLIDWNCSLKVLKRDKNLGCGLAVSSAISWVMQTELKVIILEDDVRPNRSFFEFCSQALNHFADNERIMSIGGHSTIEISSKKDAFRLSKYPEIWGWATWKRSWDLYEFSLTNLPKISFRQLLSLHDGNLILAAQSSINFRKIRSHSIDTWGYQLVYTSFLYDKLHLLPNCNLTENLGFDSQATHTKYLPFPSPNSKEIESLNFQIKPLFLDKYERLTRIHLQRQLLWSLRWHFAEITNSIFRTVLKRLGIK